VILIVSIDQRHKWSSVDEDHLLFRRFLRISENRRPIRVERPGTPPWTTPIKSAIASKGAAIGSCCSAHAAIARTYHLGEGDLSAASDALDPLSGLRVKSQSQRRSHIANTQ
jgi:hypothetical protein